MVTYLNNGDKVQFNKAEGGSIFGFIRAGGAGHLNNYIEARGLLVTQEDRDEWKGSDITQIEDGDTVEVRGVARYEVKWNKAYSGHTVAFLTYVQEAAPLPKFAFLVEFVHGVEVEDESGSYARNITTSQKVIFETSEEALWDGLAGSYDPETDEAPKLICILPEEVAIQLDCHKVLVAALQLAISKDQLSGETRDAAVAALKMAKGE